MDPRNADLTDYTRDQIQAMSDMDRFRLATRSLKKDAERITAVPEPTNWTLEDYDGYLNSTPKFFRSDISLAAGHALQF